MKTWLLNGLRAAFKNRIAEHWLVSMTTGKVYGSFITKCVPNHYQYKTGSLRSAYRFGLHFILDISDLLQWFVFFGFKELSKENLISLAKKGDIVFDIGSNFGEVAMRLAGQTGKAGCVYAFEPDLKNYQKLCESLSLNKGVGVKPFRLAMGSNSGAGKMIIENERNTGMNRVEKVDTGLSSNEGTVDIVTLDHFVEAYKLQKLDVIKIDVEGGELDVLKGGKNTIQKFRPACFVEVNKLFLERYNASVEDVFEFFQHYGYKIVRADNLKPVQAQYFIEGNKGDIICYPPQL